ncbi:MAG: Na/Pi cotransporter family protein [Peptoanaerobacter stomatis]|uniref:Na/Pi cotransporter family protein n=1 Tax=Peptoanaerobacter stomatis TaxID=796937 RepID=UPI003FA068D5
MTFFDFLSLIGGLALFLYGMEVLGEGLSKVAGGKLEKILEKLTSNPIKAVLLGAGVTAIVQSSSATTVMVIGLVNSNMIKLQQAVGVIMGANIGTTITSWILSLTGIKSDNFFITMLKPTSFSPIIALIGVCLVMFSSKERKKSIGSILIGFAILMYGMDAMSSSVEPLSEIPEFKNLFIMFQNPILGMIVGVVLTSIIQSSSASVGILQALCMTGLVPYASAVPIIMGQNIGTCVTALLSSIGTGKNGRRAALIHLYFNLIGTILFMIAFYTINSIVHFSFMQESATAVGIAVIHSAFNLTATIILLPFSNILLKLATTTIPETEDEENIEVGKLQESLRLLDDLFLETPIFALDQCKIVVNSMSELTKKCLFKAIDSIGDCTESKYEKVKQLEKDSDTYDDAISAYLIKLSTKDLPDEDRKYINTLFHIIGNFERISDHAYNIVQSAKSMQDKGLYLSDIAKQELDVYTKAIRDIIEKTFLYCKNTDYEKSREIEPLEEVIDVLSEELKNRHIQRLIDNKCSVEVGFVWSDLITDFERIADHCSNIAITIVEVGENDLLAHTFKKEKDEKFMSRFNAYKQEYILPEEA